jgi:hypothetical protein
MWPSRSGSPGRWTTTSWRPRRRSASSRPIPATAPAGAAVLGPGQRGGEDADLGAVLGQHVEHQPLDPLIPTDAQHLGRARGELAQRRRGRQLNRDPRPFAAHPHRLGAEPQREPRQRLGRLRQVREAGPDAVGTGPVLAAHQHLAAAGVSHRPLLLERRRDGHRGSEARLDAEGDLAVRREGPQGHLAGPGREHEGGVRDAERGGDRGHVGGVVRGRRDYRGLVAPAAAEPEDSSRPDV